MNMGGKVKGYVGNWVVGVWESGNVFRSTDGELIGWMSRSVGVWVAQ